MRHSVLRSGLLFFVLLGTILLAACGGTTVIISSPSGSATATSAASNPTATPGGSSPTATPTSSSGPTATPAPHTPTSTPTPSYGDGTSSLFVHIAKSSTIHTTSDNGFLASTYLDNPQINGNPNEKVFVTPNWSFNGTDVYDNHHVGVWYDNAVGRWAIYNEDETTMPTNASFNVLLSSSTNSYYFTVTANSGNIIGDGVETGVTNSGYFVFATHVFDPGGSGGSLNDHGLGVWYSGGQWIIFNEDKTAMASGESFFVVDQPPASIDTGAQVTGSNQAGDGFYLDDSAFNGNPNKILFIMPNWTYASNGVYDNSEMGVYYASGSWLIFKENTGTMPLNMAFNVLIQG